VSSIVVAIGRKREDELDLSRQSGLDCPGVLVLEGGDECTGGSHIVSYRIRLER
jgi:hypothetical protein